MADTRTRPGTDRRPLIAYLRVQQDHDREMLRILRASNTKINAELKRLAARSGVGAAVRRDQLALSQQAINREMATLWQRVGDHTAAGRANAAAAAVRSTTGLNALRGVLPAADLDYMLRSAEASARRGIATLEARLGLSQIPLAQSVYKNTALSTGKVDGIINAALARGASAKELADDVRQYIRPDVKGGVSYAAMRLGRTELNNAFHAQQVQTGINEPWTTGLLWNLSGSHPRPDECNEYADSVHYIGGRAGAYKPEEVPAKPHPNCLCFTTPETPDREEFIKQFEAGAYDDFLDAEFPDLPPSSFKPISRSTAPTRGSTAPFEPFEYDSLPDPSSFTATEAESASRYAGYSYRQINAYLRGSGEYAHPDAAKWVSDIDSAMSKSVISEDGVVYRGQGYAELFRELDVGLSREGMKEFEDYARGDIDRAKSLISNVTSRPEGHGVMKDWDLESMVGKSFTSKSYFSTSVRDSKFNAPAFSEQKIQFKINVPKGTRGFTYGDEHGERELLLDRDLTYTIIDVSVDRQKNQAIVELLVNPRRKS